MASVRELKTRWQIRFYDAKRNPQRTTNSIAKSEYTESQAEEEAEWRQQLYDRGEYDPWVQDRPGSLQSDNARVTVGQAIERYIRDKTEAGERGERRGWSESTAQRYKATLRHFARKTGKERLLQHLTPQDIRDFVYRDELADATKDSYYGILSTWTSWLAKNDLPVPQMPPEPELPRTLPDWCSREQLATIIRAFRHVCERNAQANSDPAASIETSRWWMADAWQFAFWQGLRRSEIVAIRCGGVDLEEQQMVVGDEEFVPKGKREDVIPLSEPAAEIARNWDAGSRPPGERLFRHADGRKISDAFTEARRQAVGDAEDQLDLPDEARLDETASGITLHSLRHGRAIDLIKKRRHVVYVSQFLRHASLDVTRRYLQVVPRHLHDEIRSLDEKGLDV